MAYADHNGGERGCAQATEPANDGDEPHISLPFFGPSQKAGGPATERRGRGQDMAGAVEDDQVSVQRADNVDRLRVYDRTRVGT
jgi:hypothetical protein